MIYNLGRPNGQEVKEFQRKVFPPQRTRYDVEPDAFSDKARKTPDVAAGE